MHLKTQANEYFSSADEVDVLENSVFSYPTGPILLDSLHCTGSESSIMDCDSSALHMCSHQNDVAIICHRKFIYLL